MIISNHFAEALQKNNISLGSEIEDKLCRFAELLMRWNSVYNLTALRNERDIVYLHFIDSLLLQPYLHGQAFLDVGTGAGFPGLVLAIVNPTQTWTLLDKTNKKIRFLRQVLAELDITNVRVEAIRVEYFKPETLFDAITSRAFSALDLFCASTQHLLKPTGLWLAMKGKYPQEELQNLPNGIKVHGVHALHLQGMQVERHLVCLQHS